MEPLVNALRVAFTKRTGAGFYLRAESFFNTATAIDALGVADAYSGRSLHEQSHGESFISLATNKFKRGGFYILDEPEAAFSTAPHSPRTHFACMAGGRSPKLDLYWSPDRRAIAPGEDSVLSMTKRARAPKLLLHFDMRRLRAQRCLWAQSPRATASAGHGLPAYCAAGRFPVEVAESSWISVSSK